MKTKMLWPSGKLSSNKYPYVLCVVIALSIAVVLLEITGATHFFHRVQTVSFPTTQTKGGASVDSQKGEAPVSSSAQNTTEPGDDKSSTGGSSSVSLLAPTGDFVSNHTPGQFNSPLTEVSVCNTTPGAQCQILFTMNGITKSLPTQITDRGGATYWNNWTPASIGLTAGSWQIKAISILSGQTQTTIDGRELVISQ